MIDWSKAPSWAKYAAMDPSGEWLWIESSPETDGICMWHCDGLHKVIENPSTAMSMTPLEDWKETLHARPYYD